MIQQLTLENFKCFDKLELEIKPLTLITGRNGIGKSSILQSLLMLRQSFDERFLQNDNQVLLNGELVNLLSGDAIRYAPSNSPDVNVSLEYESDKNFSCSIKSDNPKELVKCSISGLDDITSFALFADTFSYINAERLGPKTEYPKVLPTKTRHKGRLGTGSAELTASFLFSALSGNTPLPIKQLKHPDSTSELLSLNVSAWLSEITYEGVQVTASEKTSEQVELRYSFDEFKGFTFSPLHVGFGFSYLLPVIVTVLSAKPGSLILIENPEAHLHPAAQTKIGMLLALAAGNGVQLIIETHSDHLLNGIRVMVKGNDKFGRVATENIITHFFTSAKEEESEKRYKETIKIYPTGQMDEWPVGFFDEWENNLNKIVF